MQENILAVYPHPDDETIEKAGSLIKHVEEGADITLVCATLGQMGRRMGKPIFANRETLPKIRERELREACKVIGIKDIRLWRMQDKTLQFHDVDYLANKIMKVVEEVKPSIVYTFYPGHGVHPDHDALSHATIHALSKLPEIERPVVYGSAMTKDQEERLGPPDVKVDVSNVLEKKIAAIRSHRSQTEMMIDKLDFQLANNPEKSHEILYPLKKENYRKYCL